MKNYTNILKYNYSTCTEYLINFLHQVNKKISTYKIINILFNNQMLIKASSIRLQYFAQNLIFSKRPCLFTLKFTNYPNFDIKVQKKACSIIYNN